MNYAERRDFLNEHRRVLDSRLLPVVRDITDSRARTRDELESLYRKIVSAVRKKKNDYVHNDIIKDGDDNNTDNNDADDDNEKKGRREKEKTT